MEASLLDARDDRVVLVSNVVPVDDLKEPVDEAATIGTIVVVVGVLPNIKREDWMCAPDCAFVVVVDSGVPELLGHRVVDEQCPATSVAGCGFELAFPALV